MDKYKPEKSTEVVGNPGVIKSLAQWLSTWEDVHIRKKEAPAQGGRAQGGSSHVAAGLLAGGCRQGRNQPAPAWLGNDVLCAHPFIMLCAPVCAVGAAGKKDFSKKAVLITGPPGIGKTSAAHIVARCA